MKRSRFNKSFYQLASSKMGELTPIGCQMVLPGDIMKMRTTAFVRTTPLATPPMHPVHQKIWHFFVPWRLIWDDFEKWVTGGEDGLDASVFPYMTSTAVTGYGVGSLADALRIPPGVPAKTHSALKIRAVVKVWNDWCRDSQLQPKLPLSTASGNDTTTYSGANPCPRVNWEKDFFTTARPDPQLGPEVSLDLGKADVTRKSNAAQQLLFNSGTNTAAANGALNSSTGNLGNAGSGLFMSIDPNGAWEVDGADFDLTVRKLRLGAAVAWFEENMNAYGGRYTDYLARNGVKAADARLQRSEYLGGGKQTIQFSEVLQSAPAFVPSDDEQDGVTGSLAGHGVAAFTSNAFRYFFQEHGFVVSFCVTKPTTMYVDGLERVDSLQNKEDIWQKELQRIGMEEVRRGQVRWADANQDDVWAYQNRYDWLRRNESGISGLFRTTYADWHFARMLTSLDDLDDFIPCYPTTRPFADQADIQNILGMYMHRVQVLSFMDKYGDTKGLTL